MRQEIIYDVHAMKNTAENARTILLNIQEELVRARGESRTENVMEWKQCLQDLEKICRAYEVLSLILDTAANLYGSAGREAEKIASTLR